MYDTLPEIKELLLAHIHGGYETKRINWKDINNKPATFGQVLFDAVVDAAGDGDYELLSAAINAGKKKIWIIDGQYDEETNNIVLPDGIIIIGQSRSGVLLNFTSGRLDCIGSNGNERKIRLENFRITNASGGGFGVIYLSYIDDSVLRNLKIFPVAGKGIVINYSDHNRFEKIDANDCGSYGIYSDSGSWNTFEDCRIYNNGDIGFYLNSESYNTVKNCLIDNNVNYGLYLMGNYSKILNNRIYDNTGCGIGGKGSHHSILGNWIHNNSQYGIRLDAGSSPNYGLYESIIKNNNLRGNTSGAISDIFHLKNIIKDNVGIDIAQEQDTKYLKNLSGGNLLKGNIVAFENTVLGFTTTTVLGDDKVYGILEENINNNARGYVKVLGKFLNDVKVDGTDDIAAGDFLTSFTTAGIACKANAGDMAIAIAITGYTTDDSNGTISAVLIKPRKL